MLSRACGSAERAAPLVVATLCVAILALLVRAAPAEAVEVTQQFGPGEHSFVVPLDVTEVEVEVFGAQGGHGDGPDGGSGGRGGLVRAVIPVTPGETLDLSVGRFADGAPAPNTWNRGGGRTLVSQGGAVIIIAGGGGGAGNGGIPPLGSSEGGPITRGGDGGPGGGTEPGQDGGDHSTTFCFGGGGGQAGQLGGAGGPAGAGDVAPGVAGGSAVDHQGGTPGADGHQSVNAGYGGVGAAGGGAGGTGGTWTEAGGIDWVCGAGGGGGGSSIGPAGAIFEAGVRDVDGLVRITMETDLVDPVPPATVAFSPASPPAGGVLHITGDGCSPGAEVHIRVWLTAEIGSLVDTLAEADAEGAFSADGVIPEHAAVGAQFGVRASCDVPFNPDPDRIAFAFGLVGEPVEPEDPDEPELPEDPDDPDQPGEPGGTEEPGEPGGAEEPGERDPLDGDEGGQEAPDGAIPGARSTAGEVVPVGAAGGAQELPRTGGPVTLALLGLGALAGGTGLVLRAQRRRSTSRGPSSGAAGTRRAGV